MIKKLLCLMLLPFILCSCSVNNTDEITFSSWGSVTEVNIIKNLILEFERENPQIKVKFMHIPQNYFQKIHLLFASNTPPDVIFINNLYLPVYENKLTDLTDIIDKSQFYTQGTEGLSYKGKLLAVPRDISNQIFYVNTDLVNLPDKNWTLEDLLRMAQGVTGKGVFGISREDNIYWALPYLRYYGGGVLNKNGDLIIDSEESVKGKTFYNDIVTKYKVATSKSDVGSLTLAQMFIDGKIAFYLSGRWLYPKIKETAKFNWAVINFPVGKSPLPCDVSGWAIARNSKNKDAAIKFVRFMSDEKRSEYFADTGIIVPANINASKKITNGTHNEKAFIETIKMSENTPVNKDYRKITDEINREMMF